MIDECQISIVINYYNNPIALERVVENFKQINSLKPGVFEFVIVDDHSPDVGDLVVCKEVPNLRVYRIREDIAWNMPGARNVGALEARSKRILFMDIDHLVPSEQIDNLVQDCSRLPLGTRKTANRRRIFGPDEGEELKPNINCYIINRQDFFRAGGYEEEFSGHYSQEDKYFRFCCRHNGIEDGSADFILSCMFGSSTKGLDRDKNRNTAIVEKLIKNRVIKAQKTFTFGYDRVF